jgi:processive 1,2-diacylglycerol beta-glucosyltransferase
MNPRVLILSADAGAGHIRAAEAVEEAFRLYHPHVEVRHEDALRFTNATFRKTFTEGYNLLARDLPSVWGRLYEQLEEKNPDSRRKRLLETIEKLNAQPLVDFVQDYQPDAVVSTHFLPPDVLSRDNRGRPPGLRHHVVITDYNIHGLWLHNDIDVYHVGNDEMVFALKMKDLSGAKILESGIPVLKVFSDPFPEKKQIREGLGLDGDLHTVLLAAGGYGTVPLEKIVPELARDLPEANFLVVAGKNKKRQSLVEEVSSAYADRVKVFGFVNNFHELMAASDFIITKSGGLTTSECLAMGLPMIIVKPIPGQEERNAVYLMEAGAAKMGRTPSHVAFKTQKLIRNPDIIQKMTAAAKAIAKPHAAKTIADRVLEDLAENNDRSRDS